MDNVTTELLARVGEADILKMASAWGWLAERGIDIPSVRDGCVRYGDITQVLSEIDDEPRRLVLDLDFGWMWYNSEGPEE